MASAQNSNDEELLRKIRETVEYMSFAVKKDTTVRGSMGFKMKSESGKDMSFVMYIEDSDQGKEAHGEFRNPEDADILVTLPAEAFVRIYTGEVSVSAVTSLVLRGKVGVRNFDLNGVSSFMNSFEFSTEKWNSFYAYQDEVEERKRNAFKRLASYLHPFPYVDAVRFAFRPWMSMESIRDIYCTSLGLPKLSDLLKSPTQPPLVTSTRLATAASVLSLPALDPVSDDEWQESAGMPLSPLPPANETAPSISSETAPFLSSETAPSISSETAPSISSETAPSISNETAPPPSNETPSATARGILCDKTLEETPSWHSVFINPPLHRVLFRTIARGVSHLMDSVSTGDKSVAVTNYSAIPFGDAESEDYNRMMQRAQQKFHSVFNTDSALDLTMYNDETPIDVWTALTNQTQAPFDEFGRKYVWTLFNHKHTIQAKDAVKSLKNHP